ncbi:MAG: alanine/ornithine racemase family PLP-dependent enzyme, partial [Bacillota bacterium]|nr:alanine/ornithine racemase family PLP-dependent enzyme [Bacillota bacterium]
GGVIPDEENLGRLVYAARRIEDRLNVKLPYVSGGNSGSIYLLNESRLPKGINHLRIGEAMLLGRETSFGRRISGMADDVFTLKTEVIECIVKPSVPFGKVGLNAFGQKTEVADRGLRKRAIVACGRQDTICADLVPRDGKIQFIGASSDHMILDVTDCKKEIKAGDIIEFSLTYGTLLAAFTSEYIHKEVV